MPLPELPEPTETPWTITSEQVREVFAECNAAIDATLRRVGTR